MSNVQAVSKPDLAEQLRAVEAIGQKYSLIALQSKGEIERAFLLAEGVQALRQAMLPLVPRIMPLMNTKLGFLTDRDPKKPGKDGKAPAPYSMDVVADVVVEATLRGFRLCGNEFNILFGGFYATKEGYARQLGDLPGFANLRTALGVPKVGAQGVVVRCSAEWTFRGRRMQLMDEAGNPGREIAVKLAAGQGVDAALGKAERRLYKIVYSLLTGSEQGDDDVPTVPPAQVVGPAAAALPAHDPDKPLDASGEVASDQQLARLGKAAAAAVAAVMSLDEFEAMLGSYGVADPMYLTPDQAEHLIARLERARTRAEGQHAVSTQQSAVSIQKPGPGLGRDSAEC